MMNNKKKKIPAYFTTKELNTVNKPLEKIRSVTTKKINKMHHHFTLVKADEKSDIPAEDDRLSYS